MTPEESERASAAGQDCPAWVVGAVAQDASGRVGRVTGHGAGRVHLRPLGGGEEWDASAEELAPAAQSDALRAGVAAANTSHRMRERM
ncbi:hypothetical protein [Streptomyces sp. NPDC015131]|uniref:hypothetical protein n=1 Tax=Streptomyces sp. NPDC015131 TaxID=3364941 RepID=UPI0036FB462F